MIYDCFTFYNELDLLEIRLNELDPIVDKFVLVEAEKSHQNKEKILYFENNKHKFTKFLNKIIHIIVPSTEFKDSDPWYNEQFQRKCILDGLYDVTDDDFIIVSDVDEIPRAEAVLEAVQNYTAPAAFNQLYFYYYLNTQMVVNGKTYNEGSVLLKKSNFENDTRVVRNKTNFPWVPIQNGGWHFSFLGNGDTVYNKIQNYAHSEFNDTPKDTIEQRFNFLKDPFNRSGHIFHKRDDLSFLPNYVINNLNKFQQYIKK